MVESKSLKLYLFSFRNHGAFHEDEVTGTFLPRGGISIYPYANYGRPGTRYEELARQRLCARPY